MRPHLIAALMAGLALAAPAAAQEAPSGEGAPLLLGDVTGFDDGAHVIVLIPRAPEGTALAVGRALAARHDADLAAAVPLASVDETCFVLRVEDADEAGAVGRAIAAEPGVVTAYPVQGFSLRQTAASEPFFPVQDALRTLRVDRAQEVATGAGIRVALIDTGVALNHPDLAAQDVTLHDFAPGAGPPEAERHGTAMAALIVADARNGVGMAGVAPDAALLALRGCWEDAGGGGRCNTFSLALALDRAILERAHVVNLSLGGPEDRLLAALVARAQAQGAVVIAAATDGGAAFPAGVDGVVRASGIGGPGRAQAPDLEVVSAEPSGAWDFFSGASVAAAEVSGIAALIWSAVPSAAPDAVRRAVAGRSAGPVDACDALAALGPAACP